MAPTPERLRLDYDVALTMANSGVVRAVAAYADASRGVRVNGPQEAFRARYYEVEFAIRSLIGPGQFHDRFTIAIDINACPDYPEALPPCRAVSEPKPWVSRVRQSDGLICIGEMGEGDFKDWQFTLGHLILHLARLINLDEPPPKDGGRCWEAMQYWKEQLGLRPITANLDYPVLPVRLLYDLPATPTKRSPFIPLGRKPV